MIYSINRSRAMTAESARQALSQSRRVSSVPLPRPVASGGGFRPESKECGDREGHNRERDREAQVDEVGDDHRWREFSKPGGK